MVFIYYVISSIDRVSSWPGASFQNRSYWDYFGYPEKTKITYESGHETSTVKKHMEGIRDKAEGIGADAINKLHKCKREIEDEKSEQIPGIWIGPN
jgi:hypothetical protein